MESRSVDQFIYIGTAVRYLVDVREGWNAKNKGGVLVNYHNLLKWLEENRMHVSHRAARLYLGKVMRSLERSPEGDPIPEGGSRIISKDEASEIKDGASKLRDTMLVETKGFESFVVTDKRYPVATLLDRPSDLMAPGVYDALPVIAQHDFKEAGRCIAFELPTAAAFHLMRGTEDVLKYFYCKIVRQKRAALMWGPMVKSLRERKRNAPPSVLLNNLDNLRVEFRNPTQHPEKVYDIHEVQDLLSLSIDVVNRMMKHLGEA
ncbi:hypothetical protein [Streptomyces sp. NPDC049590]|uniref:hypothetical protein n=1 Tax=Streptomyces sp. NPDC049590 TaxID=3154834 RepID=UPI00343BBA0D